MRASRVLAAVLLVAVAATAPYARTFSVPFYLDDFFSIVGAPSVHALDLSTGALAPALDGFPLHRWLPRLTLAVNHAMGGLAPAGYHLVNLTIHVLTALLVLALATELLETDAGLEPHRRQRAALVTALIFAVHPLQTMTVTYVIQRMAALSALFSLAALWAWMRARRAVRRRRVAWFFGAAAAAFLAISSKENAVVLPLLVLAIEALVVGDFAARLRRRAVPVAVAASAQAAAVAAAAWAYRSEFVSEATVSALPLWNRLLTQPRVLCLYLGRFLLPWPGWLHVEYGFEPSRGLLSPPTTVVALLVVAALGVVAARLRHRAPLVAFGIAFFFLALVVEQSIVPLDFVFEHRLYLPTFGLALAVVWVLEHADERLGWGPWSVALPVVLLLAAGTAFRNEAWRDPVRLLEQDAAAAPRFTRPLLNLGAAYYERGDLERAERTLLRLLELDPVEARAWSNLAQIAVSRGNPFAAIQLAQRGIDADPTCDTCRHNQAVAFLQAGFADQALDAFRAAVVVTPRDAAARTEIGLLLTARGQVEEAIIELRLATALDPGNAPAWAGLSTALGLAGQPAEALSAARQAVALDPTAPSSRQALSEALHQLVPAGPLSVQ